MEEENKQAVDTFTALFGVLEELSNEEMGPVDGMLELALESLQNEEE